MELWNGDLVIAFDNQITIPQFHERSIFSSICQLLHLAQPNAAPLLAVRQAQEIRAVGQFP